MSVDDPVKMLAKLLLENNPDNIPLRERKIIERVAQRIAMPPDGNDKTGESQTFGENLADKVAHFGGSWTFLILFAAVLVFWVGLNAALLANAFDPYPYILLNLFLSMLASIQAPIIMMSQNRQSAKDRMDAAHDYEINLKAEIEIMALHDKLDEMRSQDLRALMRQLSKQDP